MMLRTLSRFLFGTLRGRLIIGVAAVFAVMMTLFIGDLTERQRAMLLDRQIEEATALSEVLATSSAGWIAADDIAGLQELVEAQRRHPEILFAILVDREGRVLADTDKSRQGRYMLDLPREARQAVLSGIPSLVDVATPAMIGGRHVGWARVGIGQKVAGEKLAEITRSGVAYALAAMLIGSVIAWFMGRLLTRRLYVIQQTIDAVRSGNRLARSPIDGTDEAAVIAREFNVMLDVLAERDAELRTSNETSARITRWLKSVLDAASEVAIIATDADGVITLFNRGAERMLGYTAAEMVGKETPERILLAAEFEERARELSDELGISVAGFRTFVVKAEMEGRELREWTYVRRDGVRLRVSLAVTTVRSEQGDITGYLGIAQDITERKQAEENLYEAQQVFRALIENSPDIIARYDRDFRRTYVNPSYRKTAGISQQELLAKTPTQRSPLPADSAKLLQDLLHRVLDSGVAEAVDLIWPKADNIDYWYNIYAFPEFDRDGRIVSVMTVSRDITERKRADEMLRKGETELKESQRVAQIGSWDWDAVTDMIWWSDEYYRIFGFDPKQPTPNYVKHQNAYTRESAERLDEAVKRAMETGEPYEVNLELARPTPSTQWIVARGEAKRDASGKILGLRGTAQNITERKRAEASLQEQHATLRGIIDGSQAPIFSVDRQYRYTSFNRQHAEVMKTLYGAEIENERSVLDYMTVPEDREIAKRNLDRALAGEQLMEEAYSGEELRSRKYFRVSHSPIKTEQGEIIGVAVISQDMTEHKKTEEAIRKFNQELEQRVKERTLQLETANKELEAFAYSVSHDLRAPLRAIDGFSHILLEDYADKLDADGRHYLDVVRANAVKMGQLIDDILSFSRMGRREMSDIPIDMATMAREVFDELQAAVPGRRMTLVVKDLPPARGDRAMMRQVWVNLLSNAVKFTAPRAEALIEVGCRSAADENEHSEYYVKDNGVGFDMQYVDKLFGIFQRLHSNEEFEGTGIGLAIVKRIVTRHGGQVRAEGKVDEGATMYFTLPRADRPGE